MTFPSDLTTKLLEFILDNPKTILICAMADHGDLRPSDTQSLRTGIENILLDELEPLTLPHPPAPPVPAAITNTVDAIWDNVLRSFHANIRIYKDDRILFIARWESRIKASTAALLTQLIENR